MIDLDSGPFYSKCPIQKQLSLGTTAQVFYKNRLRVKKSAILLLLSFHESWVLAIAISQFPVRLTEVVVYARKRAPQMTGRKRATRQSPTYCHLVK